MEDTAIQLAKSLAEDKRRVTRLFERAAAIRNKLEAKKQFQEQAGELNSAAKRQDVDVLTGQSGTSFGLSPAWVVDMQEETSQLRGMLSELQSAVDLIMTKHRQQVEQLLERYKTVEAEADTRVEEANRRARALETEVVTLNGKIEQMTNVMCLAVDLDSNVGATTEMHRLQVENEGMRELLEIAGIPIDQLEAEAEKAIVDVPLLPPPPEPETPPGMQS